MSYKCFGNKVEIAMIGISNAGKSTFIGTLFEDSICKLLRKIALENRGKGQTKVPVHYHLDLKNSTDGLVLEKIEWNEEIISEAISDLDSNNSIASKICKDLGLSDAYKEKVIDRDVLVESLKKIESDVFRKLSIEGLFSNYVNNIEFQESGIIKCIYVVGKPSSVLMDIMSKYKFDNLVIRDTKGLLDENFETLMEKRKILTEKGTSEDEENKILAERGLIGVNACILMNGTNATITDGVKNLYAAIFKVVANKMPTFLVERSSVLSQRLSNLVEMRGELDEISYTKALLDNKITRYNFNNMERILEEYGINNNPVTISEELVKRNFKKMLLADIADSMLRCDEEDNDAHLEYEAYVFTVNSVMEELLKSLFKLRQTIQAASEVFSSNKKELINSFMMSFQEYFIKSISLYNRKNKEIYDSSVVKDMYCDTIAGKILKYNNFFSRTGMLGVQGGLTYSHDKKIYSIAILKSGRYAIEAILNDLVNNGLFK